jgi:hypothetical protein
LTVVGVPTEVEKEFKYAVNFMGLPVPPGPGSCNSAVLKSKLTLVMLTPKVMSRRSLFIVLGQRKRPENFAEFITVEIAASELRFWTEKAGWEGESVGELKWAVTPFEVWSIGVDSPGDSIGVPVSKSKMAIIDGAGVGETVGVGLGDCEGLGLGVG